MSRPVHFSDWHNATDTTKTMTGTDVAPPAYMTFLQQSDQIVLDVAMTYAQTAHMTDNATSSAGSIRSFMAVIPPGRNHAYLNFTRSGWYGGSLAATTVGSDTTGYGATPSVDPVVSNAPVFGPDRYLDVTPDGFGGVLPGNATTKATGVKVDDLHNGDRALKVPEDRRSTLEWFRVSNTSGTGLVVHGVTVDLETLA